jgi:hypothetical protein
VVDRITAAAGGQLELALEVLDLPEPLFCTRHLPLCLPHLLTLFPLFAAHRAMGNWSPKAAETEALRPPFTAGRGNVARRRPPQRVRRVFLYILHPSPRPRSHRSLPDYHAEPPAAVEPVTAGVDHARLTSAVDLDLDGQDQEPCRTGTSESEDATSASLRQRPCGIHVTVHVSFGQSECAMWQGFLENPIKGRNTCKLLKII